MANAGKEFLSLVGRGPIPAMSVTDVRTLFAIAFSEARLKYLVGENSVNRIIELLSSDPRIVGVEATRRGSREDMKGVDLRVRVSGDDEHRGKYNVQVKTGMCGARSFMEKAGRMFDAGIVVLAAEMEDPLACFWGQVSLINLYRNGGSLLSWD